MSQKQASSGEKKVIWFGAQDPSCVLPSPLSLGAGDSVEAFVTQMGDVFGEELGPQARTLLTHALATVQAASSPEERSTLGQAYRLLTDAEVRTTVVDCAMASGRLPAVTSDYWRRQGGLSPA